ncbi:MAG: DoxX family membrane protein [Candidatus Kariarchaeaceae archaeon]|jgi:thiosulfate dehydrogenase [quinone] large subunit
MGRTLSPYQGLTYSKKQLSILVILRVVIGWHIFYEGLSKLLNPNWSSLAYLMDSKGILAGFFYELASDPSILKIVDLLNAWGLLIIGLCLMVGLFEKIASIFGIVLIGLYYLSHPPLIGLTYAAPGEGSYFVINKNLIELFAIAVNLYFPNSRLIGLDRFIYSRRNK